MKENIDFMPDLIDLTKANILLSVIIFLSFKGAVSLELRWVFLYMNR